MEKVNLFSQVVFLLSQCVTQMVLETSLPYDADRLKNTKEKAMNKLDTNLSPNLFSSLFYLLLANRNRRANSLVSTFMGVCLVFLKRECAMAT